MIDEEDESLELNVRDNIFGLSLGKMKAIHSFLGHWIEKLESKQHQLKVIKNVTR